MNFQSLDEHLGRKQDRPYFNGRTRTSRIQRRGKDKIAIVLHGTDVATFHRDGGILLQDGGWKTPTTKARINDALGGTEFGIYQERGVWYLPKGYHDPDPAVFVSGCSIRADGTLGGIHTTADREKTRVKALKKRIAAYAKGYTDALYKGEIGKPGAGDCFNCQGIVTDMVSGKVSRDPDHILSHLEESYFVPRLVFNALEASGGSQAAKSTVYCLTHSRTDGIWPEGIVRPQIRKTIRRYVSRQLGLAA